MLVKTAGGVVVEKRMLRREKIDPSYIVGRGFLNELEKMIREEEIRLLVFDMNNIRPAQVRNLEERLKCRVVGRTEIILDIFSRRARSAEAKIQVELAQLRYVLPRLRGLGGVLSRLGGGIGTRGPGEKMLETDRRHVQKRISTLQKKLDRIESHRKLVRKGRSSEVRCAVAGYTNAGKSTLINRLAKDDLFVENRLFATLDSFTRSVYLAPGRQILLTDTVGFIRNLPANLLESFRSTLEEIGSADFILHVVDATAPDIDTVMSTVDQELRELDSLEHPIILFFNKADLVDQSRRNLLSVRYPGSLQGSALEGEGMDELKGVLLEMVEETRVRGKDHVHSG
jgi:GTP-binding protein HflX